MVSRAGVDPGQLMIKAAKIASSLKQHTGGHDRDKRTETTIGTLRSIMDLIENMQSCATTHDIALRRIANLEVRSAAELIEASRWKELTAELQSLAESALNTKGGRLRG